MATRLKSRSAVKALSPPDSFHLEAAQGWLWLGDHRSALDELELISPRMRAHPGVLEVYSCIYGNAKKWDVVVKIATNLVKMSPERSSGWIDRSFALHELRQTQKALEALLPAAEHFPKDPFIPYDLACYCARLRRLKEAKRWLQRAFEIEGTKEFKLMAREDPNLRPLFAST